MAYRLKPGKSVSRAIQQIVRKQLEGAASRLSRGDGPECDVAIHEARRRVKKVRAALRLIGPALDGTCRAANKRLREVSRALTPVSDARACVEALDSLRKRHRGKLVGRTLVSIRRSLVRRKEHVRQKGAIGRLFGELADALLAERKCVKKWRLGAVGSRAIENGLEEAFRRARKGLAQAIKSPNPEAYHLFRRRVKDHWYHMRLLEGVCGEALKADERRLEVLDACLGDYHNLAILRSTLASGPGIHASRQATARCIRLIDGYQAELRRKAEALGRRAYHEKPRRFLGRVRRLWHASDEPKRQPSKTSE